MKISQFIEAAIEGGWEHTSPFYGMITEKMIKLVHIYARVAVIEDDTGFRHRVHFEEIFLQPKAWEAVGKVKGWAGDSLECPTCGYIGFRDEPLYYMSLMVSFLCNGKTLEEYIATL